MRNLFLVIALQSCLNCGFLPIPTEPTSAHKSWTKQQQEIYNNNQEIIRSIDNLLKKEEVNDFKCSLSKSTTPDLEVYICIRKT